MGLTCGRENIMHLQELDFDPTPALLSSGSEAPIYFTKRDLLRESVKPIGYVWNLPEVDRILKRPQPACFLRAWRNSIKDREYSSVFPMSTAQL
jgi:hypothetical protein